MFNGSSQTAGWRTAYALVLSVQVVFCAYQILTKLALKNAGIDPIAFTFTRAVGTTVTLLLIEVLTGSGRWSVWEHKWRFVLLGFSMACNVVGLIIALTFTTSAVVAILQVLRPIFAGVLSQILGIETFTMQKYLGMSICILGTVITVFEPGATAHSIGGGNTLLGLLFVGIHSFGQSSYVLQQPFLLDAGYSPMVINGVAFFFASGFIAVLLPFKCHSGAWYLPTTFFWEVQLFSILFVGAYSYAAMGWAARKVGTTAVMLFMLLQAILTVVAGRVFLQEQIHFFQFVGGSLIISGILIFVVAPGMIGIGKAHHLLDLTDYKALRKLP